MRRAALVLVLAASAHAQVELPLPPEGVEDGAGRAVAASGDLVAVGVPRGAVPVAPGAVHLLRGPTAWTLEATLTASDGFVGDAFGFALAVEAGRVLVGAPAASGATPAPGATYLYEPVGGAWVERARFVAPDGADFDGFGFAVAFVGARVAISAPFHDLGSAPDAGAVYLFAHDGAAWSLEAQLVAPDAAAFDDLGWSLAASLGRLAVGAPGVDDLGGLSGSVYLFEELAGAWAASAELHASDGLPLARFGNALDLDGERLLVGAPHHQARGQAYLFERVGGAWRELALYAAPNGAVGDAFGGALALDGPRAAIGSAGADGAQPDAGRVLLFEGDAPAPSFARSLDAASAGADAGLGSAVALAGGVLVAGAPRHDGAALDSGAAYVWALAPVEIGALECAGIAACPCGNPGVAGAGCANSTGAGGRLTAFGSRRASADDLVLVARDLPPGRPALLFCGPHAAAGTGALGDGLRCVGSPVTRLVVAAADAGGAASFGPGLGAAQAWAAGELVRFQAWYRDPAASPCGAGSNATNAVAVTFVP